MVLLLACLFIAQSYATLQKKPFNNQQQQKHALQRPIRPPLLPAFQKIGIIEYYMIRLCAVSNIILEVIS